MHLVGHSEDENKVQYYYRQQRREHMSNVLATVGIYTCNQQTKAKLTTAKQPSSQVVKT